MTNEKQTVEQPDKQPVEEVVENDFGNELSEDSIDNDFDDVPNVADTDEVPASDFDDNLPAEEESLVEESGNLKEFDWEGARANAKAPRVDLNGKTIKVTEVKTLIPGLDEPWKKPMTGTVHYKECILKVFYDDEGQQENYSGMRVFPSKKNPEKYGLPTVDNNLNDKSGAPKARLTQATKLLRAYAEHAGKELKEVRASDLIGFLKTKPSAIIEKQPFTNPETGKTVEKNIIVKFV